jgi:acyl-CoA thioesterase II
MEDPASPSPSPPSLIEKQLEVGSVSEHGGNVFTNKDPLWHPSGARGIFGGITIAQSLNAAQKTVGSDFYAHSMHCTFVFAGNTTTPIRYFVESVRDGRSFCTRLVRATQNDRTIFLATVSFTCIVNDTESYLAHAEPFSTMIPVPSDTVEDIGEEEQTKSPYINQSVGIMHFKSSKPYEKRIYQWIKTRGKISAKGGLETHLASLAFMSDSYFLAGLPHAHGVWEFVNPPITEFYDSKNRLGMPSSTHSNIPRPHLQESSMELNQSRRVGMMVSLDHTIFFHNQRLLRADEWLLTEVNTHWAGAGRGLLYQKIWTKDGTLVASCTQEVL